MTILTGKELRLANVVIEKMLQGTQRGIWSAWYEEQTPDVPYFEAALPREVAEILLSGVEIMLSSMDKWLANERLDEDTAAEIANDQAIFICIEQALRRDLTLHDMPPDGMYEFAAD